jgi:hypothetical protein
MGCGIRRGDEGDINTYLHLKNTSHHAAGGRGRAVKFAACNVAMSADRIQNFIYVVRRRVYLELYSGSLS